MVSFQVPFDTPCAKFVFPSKVQYQINRFLIDSIGVGIRFPFFP
jgi:hypothetical protein